MMVFIIIATLMVVAAVAVTVCVMQKKEIQKLKLIEKDAQSAFEYVDDIQKKLEVSFAKRVKACGGNPDAIRELLMLAYEMYYIFRSAIDGHNLDVRSEFLDNCRLEQADKEWQSKKEDRSKLSRLYWYHNSYNS